MAADRTRGAANEQAENHPHDSVNCRDSPSCADAVRYKENKPRESIMSELFPGRRERLQRQLRDAGVDAFLITQPINVSYLTGFTGEASYLIIGAQKTVLVSDGRFTVQLAEECPGLATLIRPPQQPLPDATAKALQQLGSRSVEFESGHVTVGEAQT